MRVTTVVLALLGGIVELGGVFAGFRLLGLATFAGVAVPIAYPGFRLVVAFAMAVMSIVGGAVIWSEKDRVGAAVSRRWAAVLVVAAILGTIAVGRFFILGGVLTLIAGILGLLLDRSRTKRAEPQSENGVRDDAVAGL